jgi:hypothetical protein
LNTFVFKPIANGFKNAIINIEASGAYYQAILIDDLKTARPSACLEYGVNPAPFNYNSFKFPSLHYKSPKIIALPSPNYPAQLPN